MGKLTKRHITVRFQLSEGSFNGSNDTVEVSGLRCSASINTPGGVSMSTLSLRVFGMSLDVMNKLTILGKPLVDGRNNRIEVIAGDDETGMASIYVGTIQEAWVDSRGAPQVAFIVTAFTGMVAALKPVPPTSYKGSVDAATVASEIARQAGFSFENSGVSVQIADPYLSGTYLAQLQDIARAGNFNCVIDKTTVAIWPANGNRQGKVPIISPETGLIGYPLRTQNGIEVMTLFNPTIIFGAQFQVKSSITPANGSWTVNNVTHDIESETPGGKWFTTIGGNILGQETAIAG